MTEDALTSPPYPQRTCTAKVMYRYLDQMREWVMEHQAAIYEDIPLQLRGQIVPPTALDELERWLNVAIVDLYGVYRNVRFVREMWDNIIREHEDSWDSKKCVRRRFHLLLMAVAVLDESCVDPETREAREHKEARKAEKRFRTMERNLRRMSDSKYDPEYDEYDDDNDDDDEDESDDSWDDWENN